MEQTSDPALSETEAKQDLFIVGIGSSAGGLEALQLMFQNLPTDLPAAYVVVQHLSPDHHSLLTQIIGRETKLDVAELSDGMKPEEGRIYVSPPNADVLLRDGFLRVAPPSKAPGAPKPSVDRFLMSAAQDAHERTVGIILSGTGSDGAYGVQSIRAAGGVTIAQDDASAKYEGMPDAAVATGCVDLVLPPEHIGAHLQRIISTQREFDLFKSGQSTVTPLTELLQLVRSETGVDFAEYKTSTIERRLEQRMTALGLDDLKTYIAHCRNKPAEVHTLYRSFLISVTRFFRDKEEYEGLELIIKRLVAASNETPLRVWIAGCATGEEAYTTAILFAEAFGGLDAIARSKLQIFASDIDVNALDTARAGVYPVAALEDVPEHLIEKYFEIDGQYATVNFNLKNVILFSDHNICQDPPFLNLDLVCIRNLLIYFNHALQTKVLTRLHYALDSDGYLFVGAAEAVAVSSELFRPASNQAKVFAKRFVAPSTAESLVSPSRTDIRRFDGRAEAKERSLDRAFFDTMAATLGPNALLITDDHRIVRVFGDVSRYMKLTEKSRLQFTTDVLLPNLAREVRVLVYAALNRQERRKGSDHRVLNDDGFVVQLEVFPLAPPNVGDNFALVVFHRKEVVAERTLTPVETEDEGIIDSLERELNATRERLEVTIEELETSHEELQSSYEELQSLNEELQATNEELETSNEELQSTNEELVTVNEELQLTTNETTALANEMGMIIESLTAPLIIVDRSLQIRKASNAACELFKIQQPVRSQHIASCKRPEGFLDLTDLLGRTMQIGKAVTEHAQLNGDRVDVQCAPLFDEDGQIVGATFLLTGDGI